MVEESSDEDKIRFDTGGSERMVIDENGDVSINVGKLTTSGANGADNQGINITDTGYSKTHKLYGDNSLHIQADSGQSILMKPNASEIARFTSDGLTFNGDTAAANALDDYEEGTWQATHGGNNMTGNGYYVKVGALVHIQGDWTSASGSSSTQIIGGLPFASVGGHSSFIVGYADSGGGHRGGYTASNNLYLVNNGNASNPLNAGQRVLLQSTYYTTD
jgi:hypothetical protein